MKNRLAMLLAASVAAFAVASATQGCAPAKDDVSPTDPAEGGPGVERIDAGEREEDATPHPEAGPLPPPLKMVDCTTRPNDDTDPKCVPAVAGENGKGPKFTGGLTTQVGHGFVDAGRLLVAVELAGADDEYGGIFSIDLTTGDRTLVAGKLNDPVTGEVTKGTGPAGTSLNGARDVAKGPNNTWIAYVVPNLGAARQLITINPATGDRTMMFDAFDTACTGLTGKKVAFDNVSGLAVGPDGSAYLALNNNPQATGKGIAKVTPDGKCSVVTLSGASIAGNNRGTGPTVIGSFLYNVTFRNDSLYLLQFNTHPSLLSIDPVTGNRTMLSVSPDKGTGPDLGSDSFAISPDGQTYWTYNAARGLTFGLVSVDAATGDRKLSEPKGGPAKKARAPDRGVWVHPDGQHLLLQYANSIILYEPATGNSNTLSY